MLVFESKSYLELYKEPFQWNEIFLNYHLLGYNWIVVWKWRDSLWNFGAGIIGIDFADGIGECKKRRMDKYS